MITKLEISNFKSWKETGNVQLEHLTGVFGTNSSGKTSLLQFLLILKQTVESADRSRVLHTGDDLTDVDLGTFNDIVYAHKDPGIIKFRIAWNLPESEPLIVPHPDEVKGKGSSYNAIELQASIERKSDTIHVQEFLYRLGNDLHFGMRRKGEHKYELICEGYAAQRNRGRLWPLPDPVKSYGFPHQVFGYYQNLGFLSDIVLAFEELMGRVQYLGPLREYPNRLYQWAGERLTGVGRRGERAVPAMLASRNQQKTIQPGGKKNRRKTTLEEYVAIWLRKLGMIHAFELRQVAPNRKEYEVRVRTRPDAPEVLITDVGFGVSQVLPVIVLCFYAPEGSTLILEQPEIHLHPSVQAGLADVFVDAIQTRGVQIILESHSEHLLRRLQRRIAEEAINEKDIALYFTGADAADGRSLLSRLDVDAFGNIYNWPKDFFGDEIGDLAAMVDATIERTTKLSHG